MDWRDGSFMHRCWAVVDLDAFEENYRALRSRLREDTKLLAVVNALFAVLALLGVVNDPTTAGMSDSTLAMTYDKPKED